MTVVVGFSWPIDHDGAASIVVDGRLVFASEEERYTRHRYSIDEAALNSTVAAFEFLRKMGIKPADVDAFAINFEPKSYLLNYRSFMFYHCLKYCFNNCGQRPRLVGSALQSVVSGMDYAKLGAQLLRKAAAASGESLPARVRIVPIKHHLAHAASAYYFSGFGTATAITVDGIGERESTVVWRIKNGEFERIASLDAAKGSIGMLYERMSAKLGLGHFAGPGKVMGLAPYGRPSDSYERLKKLVTFDHPEFPYEISNGDASKGSGSPHFVNYGRIHDAFADYVSPPIRWNPGREITREAADLAWAIQRVTEEVVLALGEFARANSSSDRLVLAGGVALNAKSNMRLHYSNLFNEMFVFPAANDAGSTIGAAAYVYEHVLGGKMRDERLRNVYLGPLYDDDSIADLVRSNKRRAEFIGGDVGQVSDLIVKGKTVAWYQGRAELGPRALGHRSIVGDPRSSEMGERLNKIKGREFWRPLAPSLLEQDLDRYFVRGKPHEFMLLMYELLEERRKDVAAVCHIDGTSRPQTVTNDQNKSWFDMIRGFKESTGEGMVVNTSFNLAGEPIVETPVEALSSFDRGEIDCLFLQGWLLKKG